MAEDKQRSVEEILDDIERISGEMKKIIDNMTEMLESLRGGEDNDKRENIEEVEDICS